MKPEEIRCEMPHPKVRNWSCRGLVYIANPHEYEVIPRTNGVPPRCFKVFCPRCKTEYIVCPTRPAA